jgi:hypothetical protein
MSHVLSCTRPRVVASLLTVFFSLATPSVEAYSRRGTIDVRWMEGSACFGLPAAELRRLKRVVKLESISVFDLERSSTVPVWLDEYPWSEPRPLDPDGCLLFGDAQGSAARKPLQPLRVGVPYEVVMKLERTKGTDPTMFHSARFCLRRQLDGETGLITLKHVGAQGWNTWACEHT